MQLSTTIASQVGSVPRTYTRHLNKYADACQGPHCDLQQTHDAYNMPRLRGCKKKQKNKKTLLTLTDSWRETMVVSPHSGNPLGLMTANW